MNYSKYITQYPAKKKSCFSHQVLNKSKNGPKKVALFRWFCVQFWTSLKVVIVLYILCCSHDFNRVFYFYKSGHNNLVFHVIFDQSEMVQKIVFFTWFCVQFWTVWQCSKQVMFFTWFCFLDHSRKLREFTSFSCEKHNNKLIAKKFSLQPR